MQLNVIFFLCALMGCMVQARAEAPTVIESQATETYTHAGSHFAFPPKIGLFEKEGVRKYDGDALDISVGYDNRQPSVAMTVYVYPTMQRAPDNTLAGQFSTCKAEMFGHHPNAKLVAEGEVKISPGGLKQSGQHATFTSTENFAGIQQPVRSELYLFALGRWFIKYRVTYPAGQQAEAEPSIRAFIDELAWPKGP